MGAATAATTTLAGTLILVLVCWYLYNLYRERFIGIWGLGWMLYAIRFVFEMSIQLGFNNKLMLWGQQYTTLFSGLLMMWGTYVFMGRRLSRWVLYCTAAVSLWIIYALVTDASFFLLNLPTFMMMGIIYIWTGWSFIRSQELKGYGKIFTGISFIIWGLHKLDYPFIREVSWLTSNGFLIAAVLELAVAAGTLIVYFEKIRDDFSRNERRFRLLAENAQDLIYRFTVIPKDHFEYISPSCKAILGYTPEEVYANPDLIYNAIYREDVHIVKKFRKTGDIKKAPVLIRYWTRDGRLIYMEHKNVPVYDDIGRVIGLEGIARDVTSRKMAEEELKKYQILFENARDVILIMSPDGKILEVNNIAVETYGYERNEIVGMNVIELRAPGTKDTLSGQLREAEKKGILLETSHIRRDGTVFPVEVSSKGTVFNNERVIFAIVRDITDRRRAEETINHLAFHDPLTDLPNRILFYNRLNLALAYARRNKQMLAVMFIDLDRFKLVNDTMGHAMGDRLLKSVANTLTDCIHSTDTVARIGGDEFTVLVPEITREEDVAKIAQRIINALKQPWAVGGLEFQITTSIGIAVFPNDGQDAESLTRNADTAMYRAKEEGDNYQFYNPSMNTKAMEQMEMERFLRKALDRNEFEVYYQPQINIDEGRVVGLEALVRWHHPQRGLLLPPDFIPAAEVTGLIIPIGEWVLRTACKQHMAWKMSGIEPVRMAVNISAYQFRQTSLADEIAQVLQETGMDPGMLELEITESTAMNDVEFTVTVLHRLREMGIRIAMDDFGTGYSSLNHLRRFPISTLKIDRSFVRDVLTDPEDAAIVATIIVLARNLNLDVIVEGVETDMQLAFFARHQCYEMQGFLFSKPVQSEVAEKILVEDAKMCLWSGVGG